MERLHKQALFWLARDDQRSAVCSFSQCAMVVQLQTGSQLLRLESLGRMAGVTVGHEDWSDLLLEKRGILRRQFLFLGTGNRPAQKRRDKAEGNRCLGHPDFDARSEEVESTIPRSPIR